MTKLEKAIKELRWLQFNFPWQDNPENDADKMSNAIHKYTGDAIELLESQQWISVKDKLPEVGDSYIVAGKQRFQGEPWEYFTDVAASNGSYIDGFWDTFNDWIEGQETHITHWMPLPEPPKEGDSE